MEGKLRKSPAFSNTPTLQYPWKAPWALTASYIFSEYFQEKSGSPFLLESHGVYMTRQPATMASRLIAPYCVVLSGVTCLGVDPCEYEAVYPGTPGVVWPFPSCFWKSSSVTLWVLCIWNAVFGDTPVPSTPLTSINFSKFLFEIVFEL